MFYSLTTELCLSKILIYRPIAKMINEFKKRWKIRHLIKFSLKKLYENFARRLERKGRRTTHM